MDKLRLACHEEEAVEVWRMGQWRFLQADVKPKTPLLNLDYHFFTYLLRVNLQKRKGLYKSDII